MAVTQAVPAARPELPGAGTPQPPGTQERPRAGSCCCPQPGEGSWGGRAGRAMHRHRSRMMLSRERVQDTFLCPPCAVSPLPRALLAARGAGATAFCSQMASPGLEGANPRGCRGEALLPAWGSRSRSPRCQQVPFPFSFPHQKPSEGPNTPGRPDPLPSPPSWMPGPGLGPWAEPPRLLHCALGRTRGERGERPLDISSRATSARRRGAARLKTDLTSQIYRFI